MREKEIRRGLVVSQFSCTALNLQEHWSEIGPLPDPDSVGLAKSVLINRGSDFCENWNGKPIHIIKLLLIALLPGGWAHPKNRYLFLWINDGTDVKQKQNKKKTFFLWDSMQGMHKKISKIRISNSYTIFQIWGNLFLHASHYGNPSQQTERNASVWSWQKADL